MIALWSCYGLTIRLCALQVGEYGASPYRTIYCQLSGFPSHTS